MEVKIAFSGSSRYCWRTLMILASTYERSRLSFRGWIAKGTHQARKRGWYRRQASEQKSDLSLAVEQSAIKGGFLCVVSLVNFQKWTRYYEMIISCIAYFTSYHNYGFAFDATFGSENEKVLFVSTVWPEYKSSAAGVRTQQLIQLFIKAGYEVAYISTSTRNGFSRELRENMAVDTYFCLPNRPEEFRKIVEGVDPTICIFDSNSADFMQKNNFHSRYENFDQIAYESLILRKWRERKACEVFCDERTNSRFQDIQTILKSRPKIDDNFRENPILREIAAILRSDLTLICSSYELELLKSRYLVPSTKLIAAPFFYEADSKCNRLEFKDRCHFVTIGTCRHSPNVDAIKWLKDEIWPLLRKKIQCNCQIHTPELHVYGAAMPRSILQYDNPRQGFRVLGHAQDINVLEKYRALLAPLRYGAGLKGKIVDSWNFGTPVVTTSIGSEGLVFDETVDTNDWGGTADADSLEAFVEAASEIYFNEYVWLKAHQNGMRIFRSHFDREKNGCDLLDRIRELQSNIFERRSERDIFAAILWDQRYRSTEYFSKWIELKEKERRV